MNKFHIYVVINTLIFYVILKSYKSSVNKKDNNSRLIYLLYIPGLLYSTYYLINNTEYITEKIKRVYPDSISS
jgi:hypothetical protein